MWLPLVVLHFSCIIIAVRSSAAYLSVRDTSAVHFKQTGRQSIRYTFCIRFYTTGEHGHQESADDMTAPALTACVLRLRGPSGPSCSPFILGASARHLQNLRKGDVLPSPFSNISAACCRLSILTSSLPTCWLSLTSPRTGKNLAPCPLPPVLTNTELPVYVGTWSICERQLSEQ